MRIKSILSQSLILFIALSSALWSTLQSDLFTVEPSGKLSVTLQDTNADAGGQTHCCHYCWQNC
jgi:hypothetical protein